MEAKKLGKFKIASLFLGLMSLTGLTLAGCERMEPAPESNVVLQSNGVFATSGAEGQDVVLLVQSNGFYGMLSFEIRERSSQRMLVTGELGANTISSLFADARGPMRAMQSSATLQVAQSVSTSKPICLLSGPSAGGAIGGTLQFDGNRWLQYNSGLLERGMEGRIHLTLKNGAGASLAEFDGMVTRQHVSRDKRRVFSGGPVAVGTSARGHVEGAMSLGGTMFGDHAPDRDHGNPASIALALPYGAGKIELEGEKRIFDFDPAHDVTYPQGRGQIQILTQSDSYIEVADRFDGHIQVPHVDFGDDVTGSGTGDFSYNLSIAIQQDKVLVVTATTLTASLQTSDGKRLDFATDRRSDGSVVQIDTELDW